MNIGLYVLLILTKKVQLILFTLLDSLIVNFQYKLVKVMIMVIVKNIYNLKEAFKDINHLELSYNTQ